MVTGPLAAGLPLPAARAAVAARLLWKRFHGDTTPMLHPYVPVHTNPMEVFS